LFSGCAGCLRRAVGLQGKGELVVDEGVGITAVRSCPAVGIADYTGDITTFACPARPIARHRPDRRHHRSAPTCDERPAR
jgi:hypothetical protein